MSKPLTQYMAEVIEMKWSAFRRLEESGEFSALEGVVLGIIRSTTKGSKAAITEALDRLDGKVASVVEIEYPKIYFRFVNATEVESGADLHDTPASLPAPVEAPEREEQVTDNRGLPVGELRPVLEALLRQPMPLVNTIVSASKQIDESGTVGPQGDPTVKSVVASYLIQSAVSSKHSVGYAMEILDQIDGKVADKLQIGGDMYINRYETIAPAGAKLVDGVYVLEQPNVSALWAARIDDLHQRGRLR